MYLVELSRMDAVSTLCDKRLVSYERKLTFHEISLWPNDVEICSDSDGLGPKKMWFLLHRNTALCCTSINSI